MMSLSEKSEFILCEIKSSLFHDSSHRNGYITSLRSIVDAYHLFGIKVKLQGLFIRFRFLLHWWLLVTSAWGIMRTVSGLFVPRTIRTLDYSYYGWTIRTLDDSYDGLFVRWTIRTMDFSYHGLFVLWTVRTIHKYMYNLCN